MPKRLRKLVAEEPSETAIENPPEKKVSKKLRKEKREKKQEAQAQEVLFAYYGGDAKIAVVKTPNGTLERGDRDFDLSVEAYLKILRQDIEDHKKKELGQV